MLVILPLAPPEISVIFRPGIWYPLERISPSKMPLQFPFTPKTIGEGYGYIFSGTTQIPSILIDTYTCTLPSVFICLFRYSLLNNLILTSDLSIAFFSLDLNECSYNQCDSPREICVNFPGTSFCNCVAGNFLIQNSCTGGKDF